MQKKSFEGMYRIIAACIALGALTYIGAKAADRYGVQSFADVRALLAAPCEQPITVSLGTFDERFGISRTAFESALAEAVALWNIAAGKTLFVLAAEGGIPVHLVYSEHQRAAELGTVITSEQSVYDAKRAEIEALRATYQSLSSRYAAMKSAYEAGVVSYQRAVDDWNTRGGAPPPEFARLAREQENLRAQQKELDSLAQQLGVLVDRINTLVDELNTLATKTNEKVAVYNDSAHEDFDQGNYVVDKEGKRITIFEFANRTELKRVLAHELGHTLGLDHVANPDSIMYSYNVGSTFRLSVEDTTALTTRCNL